MIDNFLSTSVDYQTGDLKVTTGEYARLERFLPVDETMDNGDALSARIKRIQGVDSVERRIRFGILLGNDQDTVYAVGIGADLNSPRLDLKKKLIAGDLVPEGRGLYLGFLLAQKLHIRVGDSILIATKTTYGGINGIKAKVGGLLSFGIGSFDRKFFFLDLPEARKLLEMKNADTEILIYSKKGASVDELQKSVKKILTEGDIVRNTSDQIGSFYNLFITLTYIYYFFDLLIILLASFVIISTMMQSVFERMREIGTLKAMGMTDRDIFISYTLEGAIIGAIGGIPGGILGYIFVLLTSVKGVYFEQVKNLDFANFPYILYPYIGPDVLIITILMSLFVAALAAMIPARSAGRLTAAEALRKL
jgi:putative ABC transport system permease protein